MGQIRFIHHLAGLIYGPGESTLKAFREIPDTMIKLRHALVLGSFFAASGLVFTGCQSGAPALTRGATASDSIQSAADNILTARGQINRTLAALRNLTDRPADIAAQYKVVQKEIAALQATSAQIAASADAMRTKGDAYLADWAKQIATIADKDLRSAAFDRRAEVATKLQGIFQSYQAVKSDFGPFKTSLADIQKSLGTDLSLKGLETVKPFVAKATAASEPLKASLDKLAGEFRAVGLSLQPGAQ